MRGGASRAQDRRAYRGGEAVLHLQRAELRPALGNDEIAAHGQREAARDGVALDRRNGRERQPAQPTEHVRPRGVLIHGALRGQVRGFLQVPAGAEAAARAPDDEGAYGALFLEAP